jgi:hypothetical protein
MGLFYEFIFHVSHLGVDIGLHADGQDHAAYKPGGRKPLSMTRWQYTDETGVWANGDDVGYSLHGAYPPKSLCRPVLISLADFTNGWPTGFFSEIFSYGRQCSVGFDLKSCPAIAPHIIEGQNCQYKGVKVVEVSSYYKVVEVC